LAAGKRSGSRDREDIAERELVQGDRRELALVVVDLVGRNQHWLAAAAQVLGDLEVDGGRALARVDHEQDQIGLFDRDLGLVADVRGQAGVEAGVEATRVDEQKVAALPRADAVQAITRDARLVLDDRLAAADETVEQRRLADVGAADDRDQRRRANWAAARFGGDLGGNLGSELSLVKARIGFIHGYHLPYLDRGADRRRARSGPDSRAHRASWDPWSSPA
jgi:hypothetical protein